MMYFNIFSVSIYLFMGILYIFMPRIVNKYIQFGVNVNDEILNTTEIKNYTRGFQYRILGSTLTVTLIYLVNVYLELVPTEIVFIVLLFVLLISMGVIYYLTHLKVKELKGDKVITNSQYVSTEIGVNRELKTISNWLYLIPGLFSILIIAYTLFNYDSFPEMLTTNTSGDSVEKSYLLAMFMPMLMFFFTLLFAFINNSFRLSKKVSGVSMNKVSFEQELKSKYLWSITLYILSMTIILLFGYIHFVIFEVVEFIPWIVFGFIPVPIIIVIVLVIYAGQSGNRIIQEEKDNEIIDRDDDQYWKLGSIYVNKEDPSLFVDKRFGVGLTLNFGNPKAWIALAVFFVFIVGILIVSFSIGG